MRMKSFTQKSFIMLVCFVLTVFLLPKISFAKGIIENQDTIFRDYITIGGVVLLALIVFGFIVSNNILRIRALNLENESMQRRISNYEVANKVFGSIFFECSHETNELTFDENYEAILGKMPHYKKLSEFGQTNPRVLHCHVHAVVGQRYCSQYDKRLSEALQNCCQQHVG